MDKIIIQGGRRLKGEISISGSKNAALPLLFATILTEGTSTLHHIPELKDVLTSLKLLSKLGLHHKKIQTHTYQVQCNNMRSYTATYDLVKTMRASVIVLGPLLARVRKAKVSLPGGCAIGARPINLHLKAFEKMGAKIDIQGGYVVASTKKLHGELIRFDTVTVTGTENVMMAATLAQGETVIENAAREPEVIDLAQALIAMGARIEGMGTKTIHIQGVDQLHACQYSIIPDRIEMGTFLMGVAITHGDITITNAKSSMLVALIEKLKEVGVSFEENERGLRAIGPKILKTADITTAPFPGFATDFQAQFMACMTVAKGTSVITETIFENRFMHVSELARMGAKIRVEGHRAIIEGIPRLSGAPLMASDLRASAALVLAGLNAEGITEIHRVYHIDRGYEHIERKFRKLGAKIKRVKVKY